ncbi:MAG: tRNA pseudouridine(38-40) synthase TruA [Rhizobiales bacterium]|nr:tRNA pseudouridine(38-40) synthase TruA [Hyphomicrobiales bacterium]
MPRYKLVVEYDGTPFAGWQMQANERSVQGVLEDAVAVINGKRAVVHGAGRTDAGVHALGQAAHVDLARPWDGFELRNALNANVRPHPISVLEAEEVGQDFHARFSATRRHYIFRILNRRSPPALERGKVWWLPMELDAGTMHEAAQMLLGKHDFTTFRAAACQAQSPVKTLDRLDVARHGELIEIRTDARSFLHSQVRSMVGTLKLVGEGKWSSSDVKAALDAADRARCGPVSPPDGLYLLRVEH